MPETGNRTTTDRIEPADHKTATPLVSVIIPAYDAEVFIRTALGSAVHQTYQDIEIIVIDDGSMDRTAEIVREFMAQDPRVRLLQQANAGVAAARNYGVRMARGSLIAPLDADDLWKPTKIERQVACFLAADDRLGLVYTWSHIIDEDGQIMARSRRNQPHEEGKVCTNSLRSTLSAMGAHP